MLALYAVSVRQARLLPPASFRFHLTMDTLALGYMLPVIRAHSGLSPVRACPCWAYQKAGNSLSAIPRLLLQMQKLFDFNLFCYRNLFGKIFLRKVNREDSVFHRCSDLFLVHIVRKQEALTE